MAANTVSSESILDGTKSSLEAAYSSLSDLAKAASSFIAEFDSYMETHQNEVLGEPDADIIKQMIIRKIEGASR